jgi:hypothetical protein
MKVDWPSRLTQRKVWQPYPDMKRHPTENYLSACLVVSGEESEPLTRRRVVGKEHEPGVVGLGHVGEEVKPGVVVDQKRHRVALLRAGRK